MQRKALTFLATLLIAVALTVPVAATNNPEPDTPSASGDGMAVGSGRFAESPMLAERVAAGELPSVDERLPDDPMVRIWADEIGQHGGTIFSFATNPSPWNDLGDTPALSPFYLQMDFDGSIEPGMITDWELADDSMSLVLRLRPGMKWSDGSEMTIDDIVFSWRDVHIHPDLPSWHWLGVEVTSIEEVDDRSVVLEFDQPAPAAVNDFAGMSGAQGHAYFAYPYLKNYHANYNSDIEDLAAEEGFDTWMALYEAHSGEQFKMERPTMMAWQVIQEDSSVRVMERNPFYPVVDSAGNQLPYIDTVVTTVVDGETYQLKIISGESDIAFFNTSFSDYTLYKQNEAAGDYRVVEIPGLFGAEVLLQPNQNTADPIMRELFRELDFRIAMSVAINREEINDVVTSGKGVARQAAMAPNYPFYKPEFAEAYAQFDPDYANQLLDGLGLTEFDRDGFRLRSDGEVLQVVISKTTSYGSVSDVKIFELIKEYWEDVGIKTQINETDWGYFWTLVSTEDFHISNRTLEPFIESFSPNGEYADWGPIWWLWLSANHDVEQGRATLEDFGGALPGEEPPQYIKDHMQLYWDAKLLPPDDPRHAELMIQFQRNQAENLFSIGTIGLVPNIVIAKKNIGNVPKNWLPNHGWAGDLNTFADSLFIKQ